MSVSGNPSWHREREKQLIEHVQRMLDDTRMQFPTKGGRSYAVNLQRNVEPKDREADLKRTMMQVGVFDREVQGKMPLGRELSVTLRRRGFFLFWRIVGQVKVVCLSPWEDLLQGQEPRPVDVGAVKDVLDQMHWMNGVPQTVVLTSTSGFTESARDLADWRGDRLTLLAEPTAAGGWKISGPASEKDLMELMDPEQAEEKRKRVRDEIDRAKVDLLSGGVSAEKIAERSELPLRIVEEEVKSYAKEQGLAARKIDGTLLLFREGAGLAGPARTGGSNMPFIDRLKALFSIRGETEKKVALLSERRAALNQQRDQAFEEMDALEKREGELKEQFKGATSNLTKRRLTSTLLQLRKDIERRQQLMAMLNQQINVVSTHLHNLELVQQGTSAQLPDSEELADDAAKAEEVMAELQANYEVAGAVSAVGASGMSDEEQALFEELEREMGEPKEKTGGEKAAARPVEKAPAEGSASRSTASPPPLPSEPARSRDRGEAEAG